MAVSGDIASHDFSGEPETSPIRWRHRQFGGDTVNAAVISRLRPRHREDIATSAESREITSVGPTKIDVVPRHEPTRVTRTDRLSS